jgi:3-dehydroquinate synthase
MHSSGSGNPTLISDRASPRAEADPTFAVQFTHRFRTSRDVLDPANDTLVDALEPTVGHTARVAAFIDDGVARARPRLADDLRGYAAAHASQISLVEPVTVVPGGERAKMNPGVVEDVLARLNDAELCRRSYVLAIGGGAVLDVVGFAAAVAHRGLRLVRVPTTTLAQDDSGVGVKNGVNRYGKKNYLGVFAPPWAVLNDETFLLTLSDRDWRSGYSEAVKVAVMKDASFFETIARLAPRIAHRDLNAAAPVIRRSAELHLRHITEGGDPFELTAARPLDFGHWSAHRLEQMTGFELRHGEAVAIGVALDVLYSARAGHLAEADAQRVIICLHELGFALHHPALDDRESLLHGLDEFREHLGGPLTISMLHAIGSGFDVDKIDRAIMLAALDDLRQTGTASAGASRVSLNGHLREHLP